MDDDELLDLDAFLAPVGSPASSSNPEAAAPFPQYNDEGSALTLMLSGGYWAGVNSMEEAAFLAPSDCDELTPGGGILPGDEELMCMRDDQWMQPDAGSVEGNEQWMLEGDQRLPMELDDMLSWPNQCDLDSLGMNQTAVDSAPAGTNQAQESSFSNPPALDCPQPQAEEMLDSEAKEMAEISRMASECSDEASAVAWSPDEDKLLLDGLSRLANQDVVSMCIEIAFGLPKKTALDVAKRARWFKNKSKASEQAGVRSKESAGGKTTKGKGTKDPNMKRNNHAPSKKAVDSKSAKYLIRDNDRLMYRIEENLRTGQLEDIPSFFNSVKMNLDALLTKIRDMGISTDGLSIDEKALEEVIWDLHLSSEN